MQESTYAPMKGKKAGYNFYRTYFGLVVETPLYAVADKICTDYDGGMWKFRGNGTIGYGYPADKKTYHCVNVGAYYEVDAPAEVMGIVCTLYMLYGLCARHNARGLEDVAQWYNDKYYALRNWAFDNLPKEQASMVYNLID